MTKKGCGGADNIVVRLSPFSSRRNSRGIFVETAAGWLVGCCYCWSHRRRPIVLGDYYNVYTHRRIRRRTQADAREIDGGSYRGVVQNGPAVNDFHLTGIARIEEGEGSVERVLCERARASVQNDRGESRFLSLPFSYLADMCEYLLLPPTGDCFDESTCSSAKTVSFFIQILCKTRKRLRRDPDVIRFWFFTRHDVYPKYYA